MVKKGPPHEQHPCDVVGLACVLPKVTLLDEVRLSKIRRERGEVLEEALLDRRDHAVVMKCNGVSDPRDGLTALAFVQGQAKTQDKPYPKQDGCHPVPLFRCSSHDRARVVGIYMKT